jgi:nucleoside-diphosphate-sugar epimerase
VDWIGYTPQDVERDIRMFAGRTKQYIFVSTTGVYGTPTCGEQVTEWFPVDESVWTFANRKLQCEQLLLEESERSGFPVTIVRPGHTYAEFIVPTNILGLGYGLIEHLRADGRAVLHNGGTSQWTLTHSDDFADAMTGLVGNVEAVGETFHITGDETMSWQDIFEIYADHLGCSLEAVSISSHDIYESDSQIGAPLLGDKDKDMVFDNTKIKTHVPGFRQRISIRDGLLASLQWHERHPGEIRYDRRVLGRLRLLIERYAQAGSAEGKTQTCMHIR